MTKFKNGILVHDNVPAHFAKTCTDYLTTTRMKLLKYSAYISDLTLYNFTLLPHVNEKEVALQMKTFEDLG